MNAGSFKSTYYRGREKKVKHGDLLSRAYRANNSSLWDKIMITDPVFVIKIEQNENFEL